jgi:hypothetical protein
MKLLSPARYIALATSALSLIASTINAAEEIPCPPEAPCNAVVYPVNDKPSWIFRHGTYTHDPVTGARVAQYMRTPPVEPLEDERVVTSRYRRSRTNLRGAHGSVDTYYEVQAWGNGRGGIDAEWERFHDAWKESYLQGGYYNQGPGYGPPWGYGGGHGAPGYGYGYPGYGYPGHGYGGPGYPPHGHGGHGHHPGDDEDHDGHGHGGHGDHDGGEDGE